MRTLTSKIIWTGIKNGFTVKDFCNKYNIKGEANFLEQLYKAFPNGGGDQGLREIRKNEKLHHHKKKTKEEVRKGDDNLENNTSSIEALKSTEDALSNEVILLENRHKELASKRREQLRELRGIQAKVDEICAELEKQHAAYEATAKKTNEIVRQMNIISGAHAEKLAELTSIRDQITKLETTIIAVYDDCSFEWVDGAQISLDTEEGEESALLHRLMEEEFCEDLTIKQIRTLSRLVLISKNSNQKVEFIFDSAVLEKAYLVSQKVTLPVG